VPRTHASFRVFALVCVRRFFFLKVICSIGEGIPFLVPASPEFPQRQVALFSRNTFRGPFPLLCASLSCAVRRRTSRYVHALSRSSSMLVISFCFRHPSVLHRQLARFKPCLESVGDVGWLTAFFYHNVSLLVLPLFRGSPAALPPVFSLPLPDYQAGITLHVPLVMLFEVRIGRDWLFFFFSPLIKR